MSLIKTKKKEKKNHTNNKQNNTSKYSDSESMFEDINFSALFNPNDKFINSGEKISFDLMTYDLGIFNSLSSIYKNLNLPYEDSNQNSNSSLKLSDKKDNHEEKNNENINNSSNSHENIFTDSILKLLLSESVSGNKSSSQKKSTTKASNESGFSLSPEDIDELLKDYEPMEIEKELNK